MGRLSAIVLCLAISSVLLPFKAKVSPSFLAAVGSVLGELAPLPRWRRACLPSDENWDFYRKFFFGGRVPAFSYQQEQALVSESEEEYLKRIMTCTLNKVHGSTTNAGEASRLILDFLLPRLPESMNVYGLDTRRERRYYLAQILHESDGLTKTVEFSYKNDWNGVLETFVDSEGEDCGPYLEVTENVIERNHFNNEYSSSKNKYKATFRGRGLIQLTGCPNYTDYFYHRAALKASLKGRQEDAASGNALRQIDLDGDKRKGITYNRRISDTMFCSEDDLNSLADKIREDFTLEPMTFASDFDHTANALALPCLEGGASTSVISENRADRVTVEAISSIGSREFLVDSSLWFWRRYCTNNRRYGRLYGAHLFQGMMPTQKSRASGHRHNA